MERQSQPPSTLHLLFRIASLACAIVSQLFFSSAFVSHRSSSLLFCICFAHLSSSSFFFRLAREASLEQHALSQGLGAREVRRAADACFRNPFAIGSFVNHPPPGVLPNVLAVPFEFRRNAAFVPHRVASSRRPLHLLDDFAETVPSLVLIAARNVADEELFLNYRLNPALPYPDWYWQPDPEEAQRRWARHSFFSLS